MFNKFEEGDYYIENGYRVFTAQYLEKRGYCCKSGCRHCPYGYDKRTDRIVPKSSKKPTPKSR